MGKKNKAKLTKEQALAKRLAKALGLKTNEITDSLANSPDDKTWIFFSPKGNDNDGYWMDWKSPIFGNKRKYGLVDRVWVGDSKRPPAKIPEWLTERTTLEEIDLRLTAMGF